MSMADVSTGDAPDAESVEMQLEVLFIPVSDAERAKAFYSSLGWRLDQTPPGVVQFTPRGSGCSIQFGAGLTDAAPGSAKGLLVVSDIATARNALLARGVDVSAIFHLGPDGPAPGPDPEGSSYLTLATFNDPDGNQWMLQQVTTRLPGRV
ncbi:VOC family protein [Streptomyces sp. NPDC057293]|uniref:VOC family protein n=1 Tax=unclassified Streptomyces TaxID=2593676 RepID=UPI00363AB5DB